MSSPFLLLTRKPRYGICLLLNLSSQIFKVTSNREPTPILVDFDEIFLVVTRLPRPPRREAILNLGLAP